MTGQAWPLGIGSYTLPAAQEATETIATQPALRHDCNGSFFTMPSTEEAQLLAPPQ